MSSRIVLILPEESSDYDFEMIRIFGGFSLVKINNLSLEKYLHQGEVAFQIHDDVGEFTGIGTGSCFSKYSKECKNYELELKQMCAEQLRKYRADVIQWEKLIKTVFSKLDIPFLGISLFWVNCKLNDMNFKLINRQYCDISDFNFKQLLDLNMNTILTINNISN